MLVPKYVMDRTRDSAFFLNSFFLELVLKLAMIPKTQVQKLFIENKFKSVSPG